MAISNEASVRRALAAAQNNEEVDRSVEQILESTLAGIWSRIQAAPDSYVMTTLEFAIFNRYRSRAIFQNSTARRAVERYWNSVSAADGTAQR